MAKRFKIGLIYSYNKDWVAGAYYILNLVQALNKLDDKSKPQLIILCSSKEEFNTLKNTGYPYLKFRSFNPFTHSVSYTILERVINKITRMLGAGDIIRKEEIRADILFPALKHTYLSRIKNKLFWIPDFQERFLPQFFSEREINIRKTQQDEIAEQSHPVVFSSNNAASHFATFYPGSKSPIFILQFAVSHPEYKNIPVKNLLEKYNIDKPYFFCPNQFWAHKNHITVLKAIRILKWEKKQAVLVVFSGKEEDYRNPDFFSQIKQLVEEYDISDAVHFLGFIDRGEQLQLMNNSLCVLQPSLFEGWSTSIEDAKAMDQYVIASDIPVHREQLSVNASFFDPQVPLSLAEAMEVYIKKPPVKLKCDYNSKLAEFGKQFVQIAERVYSSNKQ